MFIDGAPSSTLSMPHTLCELRRGRRVSTSIALPSETAQSSVSVRASSSSTQPPHQRRHNPYQLLASPAAAGSGAAATQSQKTEDVHVQCSYAYPIGGTRMAGDESSCTRRSSSMMLRTPVHAPYVAGGPSPSPCVYQCAYHSASASPVIVKTAVRSRSTCVTNHAFSRPHPLGLPQSQATPRAGTTTTLHAAPLSAFSSSDPLLPGTRDAEETFLSLLHACRATYYDDHHHNNKNRGDSNRASERTDFVRRMVCVPNAEYELIDRDAHEHRIIRQEEEEDAENEEESGERCTALDGSSSSSYASSMMREVRTACRTPTFASPSSGSVVAFSCYAESQGVLAEVESAEDDDDDDCDEANCEGGGHHRVQSFRVDRANGNAVTVSAPRFRKCCSDDMVVRPQDEFCRVASPRWMKTSAGATADGCAPRSTLSAADAGAFMLCTTPDAQRVPRAHQRKDAFDEQHGALPAQQPSFSLSPLCPSPFFAEAEELCEGERSVQRTPSSLRPPQIVLRSVQSCTPVALGPHPPQEACSTFEECELPSVMRMESCEAEKECSLKIHVLRVQRDRQNERRAHEAEAMTEALAFYHSYTQHCHPPPPQNQQQQQQPQQKNERCSLSDREDTFTNTSLKCATTATSKCPTDTIEAAAAVEEEEAMRWVELLLQYRDRENAHLTMDVVTAQVTPTVLANTASAVTANATYSASTAASSSEPMSEPSALVLHEQPHQRRDPFSSPRPVAETSSDSAAHSESSPSPSLSIPSPVVLPTAMSALRSADQTVSQALVDRVASQLQCAQVRRVNCLQRVLQSAHSIVRRDVF